MVSFEGKDYKITLNPRFEYKEDPDIFQHIQTYDIFLCSFVNNRYPAIYTLYYKTKDNDELNNAQNIIRDKYKTPFKYKSVSTAFNLYYSFIYQAIKKNKYKNVVIFDNAIDNLEIMLYHSSVYDTQSHIDYNYLYSIEKEQGMPEFDKLKNKLSKYYDAKNYNINIHKDDICHALPVSNKKYNLMMFGYTVYAYGEKFNEREILHFANVITTLKVLEKGGDYLFKLRGFSKNYTKQIIFLLLKYFNKVSFVKSKLYSVNLYVKCEDYHNLVNDQDYSVLLELLKKWDKMNPECGDNLNFSKKELRDQYRIKTDFDKTQINEYVTNLFDFDYPSDFSNAFDNFFNDHFKKLNKMKTCNDLIEKTAHELDANQLLEYYDKNYKNNYGRLIEFSKDYKLPLKPEIVTSSKKYQQKILRETVSIESSIDIILKDYNKDSKFNVSSYKYKDYTYVFPNLLKNKYELNLHKIAIDSRELKYYNEVTEKINIPRYITSYIQTNYQIKVTRAFIKMFELLNEYKLIDLSKDSIKAFHTCEAPGHFINATNYYIKLHNKNIKYDWYGNSLNPYNPENKKKYGQNIFGDAYGFLRKYKEKWLWGKDDTGDITNVDNIKEYQKKFNYTVDLFTSDCGLGAISKSDFFDQEKRLSILNFAQCLIALLTLKIGGNAVFKVFVPLSESITVSILYLIMKHFKTVSFVKQSAGSPGSSEIYMIALGKVKHLDDDLRDYLFDCLKNFNSDCALFPKEMYDSKFINQVEHIGAKFTEDQIDTLNRSTFYYDWPETLRDHERYIEEGKKAYAENWVEVNGFKKLDVGLML